MTDEGGLQATDTCVVNVTRSSINQAPVADAGTHQSVSSGAQVTLDGSGSSDPDGDSISYTWKQVSGTTVTFSATSALNPTFTAPIVAAGTSETLTFELTVTDSGQLQATDTCDVQVVGDELPTPEPTPEPTCATADENNSLTLSYPSGQVITGVEFASYGTPNGSCGAFSTSSCNASRSEAMVSDACVGKNSCTLNVDNDTFGDPCHGKAKSLALQVVCGTATPPAHEILDLVGAGTKPAMRIWKQAPSIRPASTPWMRLKRCPRP